MKNFKWICALICIAAFSGCQKGALVEQIPSDALLVEDFDAGMPPNYLGGDYGAWDSAPDDPSQSAEIFFDNNIRMGDGGYSLKIEYDVDSTNPAFNGLWMKMEGESFEPYEHIVFWIKGDSDAGFTERLRLELKNSAGETGSYVLSGITDEWQEIRVPLRNFRGVRDLSEVDELVFIFEDAFVTQKKGAVNIDNIYLD